MEKSSAENYIRLLEAVFLIRRLSAWGTTLGSRVARQPEVHLVDTGVMAWLLGLTPEKIASNDASAHTEYGHLVETFAVGEILKQVSWWDGPVAVGHFRTAAADEVDLVLERDDGSVFAFDDGSSALASCLRSRSRSSSTFVPCLAEPLADLLLGPSSIGTQVAR